VNIVHFEGIVQEEATVKGYSNVCI